ncbi:MAG: NAD-dependent epimerase/dehydratase family protein [Gaiellaceae bacterium]
MRVFLAGASGAIGRRLVPQLTAAGHEVTGTTRTPEKAQLLRDLGAEPVVIDCRDDAALRQAVLAARPDAIVHQLTDLPQHYDFRKIEQLVESTNELRVSSTRALLDAARQVGSPRLVWQSVCFAYVYEGDWVKDEDAPLMTTGFASAIPKMESMVTEAGGLVLRYGYFYGPGTHYEPGGSIAEDVRRRRFPIVGDGAGRFSFVHIDDAASATVAALERGAPGAYNVCDDDPAPVREWLPVYAQVLGAKPPRRVPRWLVRLAAGRTAAAGATGARGASNAKAKRELGWEPSHASWREGFALAG